MTKFRIVAAQVNPTVGDIRGNTQMIITNALRARDSYQADLIVFPEMVITGYPPDDLLLRPDLYKMVDEALAELRAKLPNIAVIIGHPLKKNNLRYNCASLIQDGKIVVTYSKHHLPNYGVFDEKRYFIPGETPCVVTIKGIKIGITVCEDLWFADQIFATKEAGAQIIVGLNASPFDIHKLFSREKILSARAKETLCPIVYVNCIGGQDELVFDGGSMAVNSDGDVTQRANFFTEELMPIDFSVDKAPEPVLKNTLPVSTIEDRAYNALVTGVHDYILKNNFKGVIIGLSGGIDSALTLAVAVDALGKDKVSALYMPSRFSSTLSGEIAKQCAENLGINYSTISIEPIFQAFLDSLAQEFNGLLPDVTEENLQARCRGTLLMAISNKKKLIVLSTGNKSEMAVGYATLYGDMVGGFCVLKDVPKTLVYRLANYRNSIGTTPVIPQSVIDRTPSAELAPNQKDTDTLPPYPILDAILEQYIELDRSFYEIVAAGFDKDTVKKVINMINRNEYKRRQAPPGVRITTRAFGRDRRYPITSGFTDVD